MAVEAKRTAAIHQRRFEIGGRLDEGLSRIVGLAGSLIICSQCNSALQTAIRRRRLPRFCPSIRNTPLAFERVSRVPAETPGSTAAGDEETFSPPKLSS